MSEKNETIELFEEQYKAYHFKTQFGATICGVQSGKTFLGSIWAARKINEFPKGTGIISAPTYKILHQATLDKFFSLFPEFRRFYKEQKSEIDLPTGGKVYIRSAENPLTMEGITADWGWLDEYGQAPRLAWTVVRSRVSMTGGQLLITTTPYSLNYLYQEFYLPWFRREDLSLSVFSWKSTDNPYFPKGFYDAEKKRLSLEEFARRYEGKFTKMEGLVYDLPDDQVIEPKEIEAIDVILGLDFGFNNPAAGAVIKVDKDNVFYITNEYYKAGRTQDQIEDDLLTFQRETKFREVYPEQSEPARLESMRRKGFYLKDVDKNLELGIDKVRELIRKRQLFVFRTCSNTIDEFNSYHYDPEKMKEEPVKGNDHLMDAARYALFNHKRMRKIDTTNFGGVPPYIPGVG